MAMNSSGPISLGGATTGQSINLEIGSPATSTVSLNDTIVRTLAGVASGQIVVPTDFYGKSLASGYFQIISSPSVIGSTTATFSPSNNSYYFTGPQPNSKVIVGSDDSGNIVLAKLYAPSAFLWNINTLENSNYNPNYLLANIRVQNSAPPTVSNATGNMIYYINKTDGSIVSKGVKAMGASGPPTAGTAGSIFNAIDFPGGQVAGQFQGSSPSNFNFGVMIFNSSLNIQNTISIGTSAPPGAGSALTQFLYYNATSFDGVRSTPSAAGGSVIFANISSSGTLNYGKQFPSGFNAIGSTASSTFRYQTVTNPTTSTSYLLKLDRSNLNITSGLSASPTNLVGNLSKNTDSSGNFLLARTGGILNFMTSSLTNPNSYVATSPTTPTATNQVYGNFYLNGYLYLIIQYATNVIGVLKIKEDGSTLGSGITASVGGYNIVLTQNPSVNISGTSIGPSTLTPYTTSSAIASFGTQPTTFSDSISAATVTSNKTPV